MNHSLGRGWIAHFMVLLISCGILTAPVWAQPRIDSERYQAPPDPKALQFQRPRLVQPDPGALEIQLTPPVPQAWQRLEQVAGKLPVGVGQAFPPPYDEPLDGATLIWTELADGGLATTLLVTSPGAAGLRLQLAAPALPADAELRFFTPAAPDRSVDLVEGRTLSVGQPYWSPSVTGDTLALELSLPPGADPEAVRLALLQISHLRLALTDPSGLKQLSDIGRSGSCEIDVACGEGIPDFIADSVAKYLFSDSAGGTFLCTGQLLNDTDGSTQIPYFLTANHCVDQSAEAASMEFYWFFQKAVCGGPGPSSVTRTGGGAGLLVTSHDSDFSLLRLNQTPPTGVGLSGWDAAPVDIGADIFSIHHPRGDLKKIAFGTLLDKVGIAGRGNSNDYLEVGWFDGVTEAGSSGAGLWLDDGGEPRLVGQLLGGGSACDAPDQPDFYGRFDVTFAKVSPFLDPGDDEIVDTTPRLLNISTNGEVDTGQGLIAGFIVEGESAKRFAVLGEDMGGLTDPEIRVLTYPDRVELGFNDDWQDSGTGAEVAAKLRQPGGERDAALALTLAPGQYLAVLGDRAGRGGRGLVSVTEIEP